MWSKYRNFERMKNITWIKEMTGGNRMISACA
jgi:hypothetical protein